MNNSQFSDVFKFKDIWVGVDCTRNVFVYSHEPLEVGSALRERHQQGLGGLRTNCSPSPKPVAKPGGDSNV